MSIGIFDSGLGGLSIYKKILNVLPEYDYIYLGDNARVPYGGRSKELIYQYTKNAVDFLFDKGCLLVILACNTASANALRRLQMEYLPTKYPQRRILGIIRPTIEAVSEQHFSKVGVIGTYATISSMSYPRELRGIMPGIEVIQNACPLLVPIIEEGQMEWEGMDLAISKYLTPLIKHNIDGLILACTHYGLITEKLQAHVSVGTKIISQGNVTAGKLSLYLKRHPELEHMLNKKSARHYFVSDLNPRYKKMTKLFLGEHFDMKAKILQVNI